ncbi:ankyrin repeat-containing domain protein [Aspergillus egyptiacus]|nr:ankyrin repeat-containing domain protein [Aspergillus egyptiacus]
MAEALGLLVNIAAVLQLATEIAQLSYNYVRDVKNAPKSQKQYLQEVSALMEILFRVEQAIRDAETTGLLPDRPSSLSDDALTECYESLSGLHFNLTKRRSRLLQPFHEKEWKEHLNMIHKYRELFADFLTSCIAVTGSATYKKVSLMSQEQDRNLLLAWLPVAHVSIRQRPSHCPGTGRWFLATDAVRQWVDRRSSFLWCYGPPGVGKSYLASILIEFLVEKRTPPECPVVYFFCDFSSQDQQRTIDILHFLLRQLIEQSSGEMLTALKESCKDPAKLQNAQEVMQLFASAAAVKPIYLVVDALDELRDPIAFISNLQTLISTGVNILVTSRDLPHIRKSMKLAAQFKVTSSPEDLRLYIEHRFRESDFSDQVDGESPLIGEVVSKSGDVFLLTRLLLDDVLDLATVKQIRKTLDKPQASLQQAYEGTMERIGAQSKARSSLARRLLAWVTYAKRRLKLEEIICAFAVDEEEELDPDNMPNPDVLLRSCFGLVVVDGKDKTIGLVHTTAYEFLQRGQISEREANVDISRTSLQYLTMRPLYNQCSTSTELLDRFKTLEFLEYSAKHWGDHITDAEDERLLRALIRKLLYDDGLRKSSFQSLQYRQELAEGSLAKDMLESIPTNQGPLHVAAYWNLPETIGMLLSEGEKVSCIDSHSWTPLHWACSRGNLATAELLIRHAADVNAKDTQGWTPLFWTAFRGNLHITRLLLSNGANHLSRSTLGWTALHWAISGRHFDVAKELLDYHSQSQQQEPTFYKMCIQDVESYAESSHPILMAADSQDTSMFDLLVQHLETPGGFIGDAKFNMIWSSAEFDMPASRNPWRTMTKGEMVNGRESDLPRFTGRYAEDSAQYRKDPIEWKSVLLISAIRDDQLSSMQLLIKAGADVNYDYPLHVAASREDPRYVQCLLENGADPNRYIPRGRTPLHEAVLNGFLDTVTALIDGGADPNLPMLNNLNERGGGWFKNVDGTTALIQACGFLFSDRPDLAFDIAQLLLSRGSDVGIADKSGMTVLHYAAMQPYVPLIKLFINAGCSVSVPGTEGYLPIHFLANCRDEDIDVGTLEEAVKVFLSAAREDTQRSMLEIPAPGNPENWNTRREVANSRDNVSFTPMAISLRNHRWKMALVLHAEGAQIPADQDLDPILVAAIEDHADGAVDLLLKHGASPPQNAVFVLLEPLESLVPPPDSHHQTALYSRLNQIMAKLVSAGVDINYEPAGEDDVLIRAVRLPGRLKLLRNLISLGADIYSASPQDFDVILLTAIQGDCESLAYLLDHTTSHPNQSHWSRHWEDSAHEEDILMRLCFCIQRDGILHATDRDGHTLLHLAAEGGNIALIKALLKYNAAANVEDSKGWLPIHYAGISMHASAVEVLLAHTGESGLQPSYLSLADQSKNFWLEALAKPTGFDSRLLHQAVLENSPDTLQHLLGHGMNPNACIPGSSRKPILHEAAEHGRSQVVSILISHGADIEATDIHGWRALHSACYFGHGDIAKMLIEAGCDIHAATVEWNESFYKPTGIYVGDKWAGQALHLAVMAGSADVVEILLDKGVDVHACTQEKEEIRFVPGHGPTALHLALDTGKFYARRGQSLDRSRLPIAKWLVSRGCTVDGIIPWFSLADVLSFKEFPELWDALRDMEEKASRNRCA